MKTLSSAQLRRIILETVGSMEKRETAFSRAMLNEDFAAVSTSTNIADLDGKEAYAQLTSGDEEAPLIQAMMASTGWASGAVGKAGGAAAIKDWAESVGEAELASRITKVGEALPATGLAKKICLLWRVKMLLRLKTLFLLEVDLMLILRLTMLEAKKVSTRG